MKQLHELQIAAAIDLAEGEENMKRGIEMMVDMFSKSEDERLYVTELLDSFKRVCISYGRLESFHEIYLKDVT